MHWQRLHHAVALVALLSAPVVAPDMAGAAELKPFTASYSVSWRGISGTAQIQLEKLPDGRWTYRRQTNAPSWVPRFMLPAEMLPRRSVLRIEDGRVIPESFVVDDGTSSDAKDQSVTFDWSAGRIRGMVERKPVDLPIQAGLQDELSVQVALMQELLAGRTPERFVALDDSRIKDYQYSSEGQARLKTEIGEYDTVIFRSSRPGSRNGTWIWCAPDLGYLPLKVERREGRNIEWSMRLQQVAR